MNIVLKYHTYTTFENFNSRDYALATTDVEDSTNI